MPTVEHPRIRPGTLEDRPFQERIASTAVDHNTLVVLPTGLGKTAIALRVIAEHLRRTPTKSVLLLAPTRPLVLQHAKSVADTLFAPTPLVLTGTVAPGRRAALLHPPQVVVATPQVIEHDLTAGTLDLAGFSLVVFDEAHRAVGDYPYVEIGRRNREGPRARVLALTASPGARRERIEAVWANLDLERFEFRTLNDADVAAYHPGIDFEVVEVKVPAEVRELAVLLRTAIQRQTERLVQLRRLPSSGVGRREVLAVGEALRREIAAHRQAGETIPPSVWSAVTAQSAAIKGLHALELVESQGVQAVREFLDRQERPERGRVTPSARAFLDDPDVERAAGILRSTAVEHPKVATCLDLLTREIGSGRVARAIVFTQYRQTAELLVHELARTAPSSIRAARFVGQAGRAGDEGLNQKEQAAILDRFRSGELNCLVATSVAEEGLDIPSTDLVIFYEPVPDLIRTIQRRGRTGRGRPGRVVVLVAEGTRDVALVKSAPRRERRMLEILEEIQSRVEAGRPLAPPAARTRQRSLGEFAR